MCPNWHMHMASVTHTQLQMHVHTHRLYKGSRWKKTLWMSMRFSGDSEPCQQWNGPYVERNVMTRKTIGVEYGRASTLLWHAEDGWQVERRSSELARALQRGRGLVGWGLSSRLSLSVIPWKYISTPAFLFMPAPLLNAQGYWFCLNLSERSSSAFLVLPGFFSIWHLDSWLQDKARCGIWEGW